MFKYIVDINYYLTIIWGERCLRYYNEGEKNTLQLSI